MNVDDVVAEKIADARRRIAANKRRRTTQAAARQAGLTERYRIKVALLDAAEPDPAQPPPTEDCCPDCCMEEHEGGVTE